MSKKNLPAKQAVEEVPVEIMDTAEVVVTPASAAKTVRELAEECRDKLNRARSNNLRILWEIGSAVHLVLTNKKYGDNAIELFIAEMDDITVQKKELYKWRQFYTIYSADEVKILMQHGNISWTSVSQLIRVKEPEARKLFEDALASKQLRPSDLQSAVTQYNSKLLTASGGDNTAEGGSAKSADKDKTTPAVKPLVSNFRKLINYVNKVLEILPACVEDVNSVADITDNEDAYERTLDVFDEYNNAQRDKLLQAVEALNAILDDKI